MRNNFLFMVLLVSCIALALSSCTPEAYEASGPPLPPTPINTDSIINPRVYFIAGQTWMVERYRIGQIGEINLTSDTLSFNGFGGMTYNEVISDYAFYPSASVYVLTMYDTPWGMLSGSVNTYNLEAGVMNGLPFTNIISGGNGQQIYLWMRRL